MPANNCHLIEDHHEALEIWRRQRISNVDLVHIDAHIDFEFHATKPISQVINEAGSIGELRAALVQSIAFRRYEKDFEKQTDIGNYIYPAMRDGIVKNFYWVIPGGKKEFNDSLKELKSIVKALLKRDHNGAENIIKISKRDSTIETSLMGRGFVITTLDKLPTFENEVLFDIDTDFLVKKSLRCTNPISLIGKRKPWLLPTEFANILHRKIKKPICTTIAYSVNGGFTPMKYKHWGDEIAYRFFPRHFKRYFARAQETARYFHLFETTGSRKFYNRAVRLNPHYRAQYNNYGPLYLRARRFSKAEEEFTKIIRVDPKNAYALAGLGVIHFKRRDFIKAREYFGSALKEKKDLEPAILGLAHTEFKLGNLRRAENLFRAHQRLRPLDDTSYKLLGDIYLKEKNFNGTAIEYKKALNLGYSGTTEILLKLLKIKKHCENQRELERYIIIKLENFKKRFYETRRARLRKSVENRCLLRTRERIKSIERLIGQGAWIREKN